MKNNRSVATFMLLFFSLALVKAPSSASSPYDDAVKLFGEKNYRAAAAKFETVIASSSKNPSAIYYCALSHQMSNNLTRAQQLFEYVSKNYANSSVAPMANKALSQLSRAKLSGNSQGKVEKSSAVDSEITNADSQENALIDRARVECDAVMKKADQQIEEEKANSQQQYIYSDGRTVTDISQERKREIINEAQEHCRKIMETAERSARTKIASSQSSRGSSSMASSRRNFNDLIAVIRNQGDHPPVSTMLVEQVKSTLASFPPQFIDLLRANKAKVQITPTMVDLFPDLKNTRPRGYEEGHTYKNCPALFSYPNIVISEYALTGDDDSGWQKTDDPVGSMRHEMGHALDAFLGNLTQTEEFKHVYYLDLGRLDQQTREHLSYYTQKAEGGPSEAFAEVFAGLYGKRSLKERQARTDEVLAAFPGLASLIKKKIGEINASQRP